MTGGRFLIAITAAAALGAAVPGDPAYAQKARVTGLSDVNFGTIAGTGDQTASQNLCAYSASNTGAYSVTATGSGSGGAFALAAGTAQLPYEVSWAGSPNQSGGTLLLAGALSPGWTSSATHQSCNNGPSSSATLTVAIRSAVLSAAPAGSYSGTLQITIAPE